MRSLVVVVVDPSIESFLGRGERHERLVCEELLSNALMEAFDLPRGVR
jgi:hypothetical protein